MELDKILKTRRSIRQFSKAIDLSLVKEIVRAGTFAPSASNKQHWHLVYVDDSKLIQRLYEAGAQKLITHAPGLIAVFYDTTQNKDNFANIQSVSAAVQNMLLKAHDMGFGGCWIAGFGDKEKISLILKAPSNFEIMCFVTLGKPALIPPSPPKKPFEQIFSHNKFQRPTQRPNSINPRNYTLEQIKDHQSFTSRAKSLGTDYDIYSDLEIAKIINIIQRNTIAQLKIGFVMSYDGTLLKEIFPFLKNEVIDFELSKEVIDFVSFKAKNITYKLMDSKIFEEDNSIDTVISLFSLERFPNFVPILNEMKRISNDKVIIFVKNKNSFYGLMFFLITKILGLKKIESFFFSSPFAPLSVSKIKKEFKGFDINCKSLFFLPPELLEFRKKINGYLKRHNSNLSFFKFLIKPALFLLLYLFYLTNWIKLSSISSSVVIIAKKTTQPKSL